MRLPILFVFMFTAIIFKLPSEGCNCFQSYIENFIAQKSPIYIVYDSSEDQENDHTNISEVFYHSESLSNINLWNLVDNIVLKNYDVVCIQDVLSDDAYNLYNALIVKENYAHFLYVPPFKGSSSLAAESSKGFCIVSKYSIGKLQFTFFNEEESNEGFVDFVIENKNVLLGHIYATSLGKIKSEEKILQIKEKIQIDIEKNTDKLMPFILFGALNHAEISSEAKAKLEEYFSPSENGPNCMLLVKNITIYPKVKLPAMDDNSLNSAHLNFSQEEDTFPSGKFLKDRYDICSGKHKITNFSRRDRDQNNQAEITTGVHGTVEWGGKDGVRYGGSVYAEARDDLGNSVDIEISQKSTGEGNVNVNAEYKNKREDHP